MERVALVVAALVVTPLGVSSAFYLRARARVAAEEAAKQRAMDEEREAARRALDLQLQLSAAKDNEAEKAIAAQLRAKQGALNPSHTDGGAVKCAPGDPLCGLDAPKDAADAATLGIMPPD